MSPSRLIQIRSLFSQNKIKISEWAVDHQVSLCLTYKVLQGKGLLERGKSVEIARKLLATAEILEKGERCESSNKT